MRTIPVSEPCLKLKRNKFHLRFLPSALSFEFQGLSLGGYTSKLIQLKDNSELLHLRFHLYLKSSIDLSTLNSEPSNILT